MVLVTRGNNMRLLRGGRVQALIMPGKPREFTPDQLFSALQGAWLEPVVGNIWQENTGVTPTTAGGQTIGKIADQSGWGNNATQATAGNRPTYQLDSNNLPLARHDTTDSLTVSLPSINVRRNLLTNSQQIQASPWGVRIGTIVATGNYALAPDGTVTATRLEKTVVADSRWQQMYSFAASTTYTASVYFKKTPINAVSELALRLYLTGGATDCYAMIDTLTGATALRGSTGTVSSVSEGDYWRIIVTKATTTGTVIDAAVVIAPYLGANIASPDLGLTGSGIYWGAQLELGSVATDYQRVTDWTSEAYSSSGSVYFATPVGMSALHNQSMGTTYQLPAINTDVYSWIVVPQRLSTKDEENLAIYMGRKAGLS